ncbi:hypothetical protein ABVT39_022925 [Epinephelus coioides]
MCWTPCHTCLVLLLLLRWSSVFVLYAASASLMPDASPCCGIHSQITTVSKVSVKAGDSISIPCLYEPEYKTHVKYLCKGYTWEFCQYKVKTNEPDDSGKFLISDDPNQTIFTVTINDLKVKDTAYYWCAVEIDKENDVKKYFHLSFTKDTPSLYVDQQEITAYEGGSVTVRCHCQERKERKWCRLSHLHPAGCVSGPSGSVNGTRVTINASARNVFTVTMSGLRTESSGWYWCGIKNFQMPVHITVHALTSTTTTTTTTTTPSTADIITTLPTTAQHSSLLTSSEPHTAQPTNSTINRTAGESQQDENKSSTMVIILTTTLILLLLIVLAAFLGWKMMRRYKNKPQRMDITVGSHTGSDPDVQYATIVHKQHVADQQKNEDSVTYSNIVLKDRVRQMAEPVDGSVIYSTVHSRKD